MKDLSPAIRATLFLLGFLILVYLSATAPIVPDSHDCKDSPNAAAECLRQALFLAPGLGSEATK